MWDPAIYYSVCENKNPNKNSKINLNLKKKRKFTTYTVFAKNNC